MGQMTVYLDEETERLVKRHVNSSGESASKWVAEAVRRRARTEWPADVLALFGSWKDFPETTELRQHGRDLPREKF